MPWLTALQKTAAVRCTLLLAITTAACAADTDPDDKEVRPARAELKCHAAQIEADLESDVMGSAFDSSTGELTLRADREYIVSSTYGIPKRGPGDNALPPHYQELMGQIIGQLQSQSGLLGLQLSTSASCGSGRTLAVWESEEQMFEFVASAPHLEAMRSAKELLQPGYAVTHWTASSAEEMTLRAAASYLAETVK